MLRFYPEHIRRCLGDHERNVRPTETIRGAVQGIGRTSIIGEQFYARVAERRCRQYRVAVDRSNRSKRGSGTGAFRVRLGGGDTREDERLQSTHKVFAPVRTQSIAAAAPRIHRAVFSSRKSTRCASFRTQHDVCCCFIR